MIQPPAPVGRARGPVAIAAGILAVAIALPLVAIASRAPAGPRDATTARPGPTAASPRGSAAAVATADVRDRVTVPAAPGPIALAVGAGHAWIASAGDATLRRVEPDGTVDAVTAIGARYRAWPRPAGDGPTIGLAAGRVWVAGIPAATDLLVVDPRTARMARRFVLPSAATGIAGGFGAAWIATDDGGLVRADPRGALDRVLGPSPAPVSVAIGERYVWVSRAETVTALAPDSGRPVATFRAGGGSIAVDAGTVWILGAFRGGRDLTAIDEPSLEIQYRSDVATSGFAGIAWALPSIVPTTYADSASLVAPRSTDSALAGSVAWVARPVEGVVWRIAPSP